MEYPVLTGFWMYLISASRTGTSPSPRRRECCRSRWTSAPLHRRCHCARPAVPVGRVVHRQDRPPADLDDTAIMCLAPLLIVHAFTNWDLIRSRSPPPRCCLGAEETCPCGCAVRARHRAKLYPVLLLGPLLILCLRTGRCGSGSGPRCRRVGLADHQCPVMLAWPAGWYEFIRLNSERPPEYDSWYFIYATLSARRSGQGTRRGQAPAW